MSRAGVHRFGLLVALLPLLEACSGGGESYAFAEPTPDPNASPPSGLVVFSSAEGDGGVGDTDGSVSPETPGKADAAVPEAQLPVLTPTFGVLASWLHACVLTEKGTVACWGNNEQGQIAPGLTATIVRSPAVVPKLDDAIALAAGVAQTCAIRAAGTVVCWGGADGSPSKSALVTVMGVEGARRIAAGGQTCVLRSDKTVVCWAPALTPYPVAVKDLSNVIAISATISAQCALHGNGEVNCWGKNAHGELGDGTTNDATTPVRVTGLDDAQELAASGSTTCAIRKNGAVVCWGNLASTPDTLVPTALAGVKDATAVGVGIDHACVVNKDGATFCMGSNTYGELGDGTTSPKDWPVRVEGSGIQRVVGGFHFTCASGDKEVFCWGYNGYGQLGTGSTSKQSLVPVALTFTGL